MLNVNTPELLAPAGTLNKLNYALAYGADAVYAGMPRYSLRVRENDFLALSSFNRELKRPTKQANDSTSPQIYCRTIVSLPLLWMTWRPFWRLGLMR